MTVATNIVIGKKLGHRRKLRIVFALTFGYLIVEVVGGLLTRSLALLADAGHMLTDVGGLAIALFAMWFAERPATLEKSYGYYRAEILGALVNAVMLIFVSLYIVYEAYRRFIQPPEVLALPMMVVAVVGLIVNLVGIRLLRAGAQENLNLKAAYLDALGDMLSSIGVILAALVMLTTGWYLADPLISIGIGLFILPRTWNLLKQTVDILMEAVPEHISLEEVGRAMISVEGIEEVHDLHIWTLTSGRYALSAHVTISRLQDWPAIQKKLETLLADRFRISHTTLQAGVRPGHRIEGIRLPKENRNY